jgi:Family of unknown function (DUF6166)
MKLYAGWRTPDGCEVYIILPNKPAQSLPLRLDLANHSPTGFEWGYGGSGPAQLALALLADCLGDDEQALGLYQQFKWAVVVQLPIAAWTLNETDVRSACERIKQEQSV